MKDVTVQAMTPWVHITLDRWSESPGKASPAGFQARDEGPPWELAVLSVNGPDRVGFVAGIGKLLYQHRTDIAIESGRAGLLPSACDFPRMAYGGQYMLCANPAGMERFRQTLRSEELPLLDDPEIPEFENDRRPPVHYQLTIFASNDQGIPILARVSALLAKHRVNIASQLCQTIPQFGVEATSRKGGRRGPGLFRLQMDVEILQANAREIIKQVRKGLNFFRSEFGWGMKFDESLSTARLTRAISGIAGCDL